MNTAKEHDKKPSIRERYQDKPITFHKRYRTSDKMKWPKVIRNAYAYLWLGKTNRAIIKAPRGGGKSKLLGTLGFDMWFFKNRNVVNMGGSLNQAKIVYNYFSDYTDLHPDIKDFVEGDVLRMKTESKAEKYFSCVTASQKQVRGKHPDVLLSDETCETKDEVIKAALPSVNTSENPLIVMASTFHQVFGVFQEVWDNAEQYGYKRFSWDIFDIAEKFSPEDWKEYEHIDYIDKLKERADGRTGDPNGWIPLKNIVQGWREKATVNEFDIVYMGSRPSAAGLILNPEDVDTAFVESLSEKGYTITKGAERVLGIDWGFSSMTSVTDIMRHKDNTKVVVDQQNYTQVDSDKIIQDVIQKVKRGGHRFIMADSEAKFENSDLQNKLKRKGLNCKVVEVKFSTEKNEMVGNLRAHFERKKIVIPKKFKTAYWQLKNYRYKEGTDKPKKENDHIPDSIMCALQKKGWKLGSTRSNLTEDPETGEGMITKGLHKQRF